MGRTQHCLCADERLLLHLSNRRAAPPGAALPQAPTPTRCSEGRGTCGHLTTRVCQLQFFWASESSQSMSQRCRNQPCTQPWCVAPPSSHLRSFFTCAAQQSQPQATREVSQTVGDGGVACGYREEGGQAAAALLQGGRGGRGGVVGGRADCTAVLAAEQLVPTLSYSS